MSEELVMPRLSDTMEEGTIGRWLVHEGDAFAAGDVLAEIETDKATMEFQAYDAGTVLRILVGDGETVALGAPIAIVGAEGETADEAASAGNGATTPPPQGEAAAEPEPKAAPARKPSKSSSKAKAAAGNGSRATAALRVSPIARRMADEAGIDLAAMAGRGSGPEGRVVKADVERLISSGELTRPAAADAPPATQSAPAGGEIRELTPMLKAVATRMAQSKQSVPHFYVESEIDMTRAMQLRAELNSGLADSGDKISVNDLIVRASALALIQHPQAHRSYVDGMHVYHAHANIGIAVALDDGLIVPVLNEADTKPVREISRETRDLAGRARAGKLKQREIEGATFSVSNLGMFDVANFEAIINPPESAIIAVGATVDRPVVVDGEIVVHKIMRVTLSCDHRACSGADGAKLLLTIKQLLQSPSLLLV
ncbi:MAG TPA: dihydrolipoamide acetyltransferase family protein [Gaiellales bacterium]|nr:dihydrolipoamide acetyltransferase family protein [Gaiellales bacterium]